MKYELTVFAVNRFSNILSGLVILMGREFLSLDQKNKEREVQQKNAGSSTRNRQEQHYVHWKIL
jgi:hypothetical protein